MKTSALLLWLSLLGHDIDLAPQGYAAPSAALTAAWIGEWLVRGDRRPLNAVLVRVTGRDRLASKMTFGEGRTAIIEHWVADSDGRSLILTRGGVGDGRLTVTEAGRLVGRLSRHDDIGPVTLTPVR
jgi:hypothetical protein